MMKKTINLFLVFITLISCVQKGKSNPKDFVLRVGDYWVEGFSSGSFPGKAFSDDKVYCSSINSNTRNEQGVVRGLPNYLYCFDLNSGKVDWRYEVENHPSSPPIILDTMIYYSTFTGDLHCLTKDGKLKWKRKADGSFADHSVNPLNNNLQVSTVANGVFEYDANSGEEVYHISRPESPMYNVTFPILFDSLMIYSYKEESNTGSAEYKGRIVCIADSSMVWTRTFGEINRMFHNAGQLFFVDDKNFYCLDMITGETQWSAPNNRNGEEVVGFERNIVYLSNSVEMNAYNVHTGQKVNRKPTQSNKIYSVTNDQNERFEITVELDFFSPLNACELSVKEL